VSNANIQNKNIITTINRTITMREGYRGGLIIAFIVAITFTRTIAITITISLA